MRTRLRADAGLTLVELLMVMLLMAVVGTLASTWVIGTQRTAAGFTARVDDLADARLAVERITRDLRVAIRPRNGTAAFAAGATVSDVTFYANLTAGPPLRVRYVLTGTGTTGQLVREQTAARGTVQPYTYPAAPDSSMVLARSLDVSVPLLTYYDVPSSALAPCTSTSPAPSPCATAMPVAPSVTQLDAVGSVQVEVAVRSRSTLTPATRLETRVRLENAGQTTTVP